MPASAATQSLLAPLVGRHVQVGQVQHAQRLGVGREHRHVEPAQVNMLRSISEAYARVAAPAATVPAAEPEYVCAFAWRSE